MSYATILEFVLLSIFVKTNNESLKKKKGLAIGDADTDLLTGSASASPPER